MLFKPGKEVLGHPDQRALAFATTFLLCALLSALGAGLLALLGFVPAAAVVDRVLRRSDRRRNGRNPRLI